MAQQKRQSVQIPRDIFIHGNNRRWSSQDNSMLCKMPSEIVKMIVTEVCAEKVLRIYYSNATNTATFEHMRRPSSIEDMAQWEPCCDPCKLCLTGEHPHKRYKDKRLSHALSLLLTCRRLYSHTMEVLYTQNKFFIHYQSMVALSIRIPLAHRVRMRYLEIKTNIANIRKTLVSIASFQPGWIKELRMRVEWPCRELNPPLTFKTCVCRDFTVRKSRVVPVLSRLTTPIIEINSDMFEIGVDWDCRADRESTRLIWRTDSNGLSTFDRVEKNHTWLATDRNVAVYE